MRGLEQAVKKIRAAKRILIASHINPDGDAIGSLLALGLGIEQLGKKVYLVNSDDVPKNYRLLPGAARIVKKIHTRADLAIAVDCNVKEMLGETYETFTKANDILEIDHHEFRRPFGTLQLIDHRAAAVGEMVYVVLRKLRIVFTKEIAQNILTSLIVETNSFRLPQVRAFTFMVCADLMKTGLDFEKLTNTVYWIRSKESVLLTGICFSRCRFLKQNRIVWSIIRKTDIRKQKGREEDVDAVADEMRSIQGVKVAVLFREERKGLLRVSLRSKDFINVAAVAQYYSGGGHFDVAGCFIPDTPEAMREVLRRIARLFPQ